MTGELLSTGESRAYLTLRFVALLGAAILAWLAIAGMVIAAVELRDRSSSTPAPTPASSGLWTDARGATCPISAASWPDRLCPESLLP